MIENYLVYKNNIYLIISISIFLVSLRMELFIIMIINNIKKGNKWYEDNLQNNKKEKKE